MLGCISLHHRDADNADDATEDDNTTDYDELEAQGQGGLVTFLQHFFSYSRGGSVFTLTRCDYSVTIVTILTIARCDYSDRVKMIGGLPLTELSPSPAPSVCRYRYKYLPSTLDTRYYHDI